MKLKPPLTRIITFALIALYAGCTSVGRLEKNIGTPNSNEAIYIIGVKPENHRVFIFPGDVRDGIFHQNIWSPASYYGSSEKGYVVAKAHAGDTLGITQVLVTATENSLLGANFEPCDGQKTITFDTPGGKVIYVGDVEFKPSNNGLNIEYSQDYASAKNYLTTNFPMLANLVQQSAFSLTPVSRKCNKVTVTIPVYIQKR